MDFQLTDERWHSWECQIERPTVIDVDATAKDAGVQIDDRYAMPYDCTSASIQSNRVDRKITNMSQSETVCRRPLEPLLDTEHAPPSCSMRRIQMQSVPPAITLVHTR